jgi:protein-tyrosine phosphatase
VTLREVPVFSVPDGGANLLGASRQADPNDQHLDIVDPIGRPAQEFDAVAAVIEEAIDHLVGWIARNSQNSSQPLPWSVR